MNRKTTPILDNKKLLLQTNQGWIQTGFMTAAWLMLLAFLCALGLALVQCDKG